MPKLPTAQDVKKARKQATAALEQARTPLYAVLGAGDLATEAVRDYVSKARAEAGGQAKDVQTRVGDLQARLAELQERLVEVRTQVRSRVRTTVGELPDEVAGLRGRLEPAELRHSLERYLQSLQDLYERLATRGEGTVARMREKPQVKRAIDRVEEAADSTEERVGKLVEDARELTHEVLGRVSRRTRSAGEKAAVRVEKVADEVADEVADAVEEAGAEVAGAARSVSHKAADRTQPTKPAARKSAGPNAAPSAAGTKA
ncbi:MAG TPA: hypothetical protein VGJ95_18365 [Pseudonocardiaceae bacterium]|jgi:heparin binding hemagglutinin HbhA